MAWEVCKKKAQGGSIKGNGRSLGNVNGGNVGGEHNKTLRRSRREGA